MSIVESQPSKTLEETQIELREMIGGVRANLSILALMTPRKTRSDFKPEENARKSAEALKKEQDEKYDAYRQNLRYQCQSATITTTKTDGSDEITPSFLLNAGHLRAEGHGDWKVELFSPIDDALSEANTTIGPYVMNIMLCGQDAKGEDNPYKTVTVDCPERLAEADARLVFWSQDGAAIGQGVIEPSEIERSYPFRVVTQIADQLQREANALLAYCMDSTAA